MKHKQVLLILLVSLLIASLACSAVTGGDDEEVTATDVEVLEEQVPDEEATVEQDEIEETDAEVPEADPVEEDVEAEESSEEFDTIFPLPPTVENFMGEGGTADINFQTDLSLEESIEFYRQAFADEGMTERSLLTTITEGAFSMVFDGHPEGTVVIQGVDLKNGTTNINIRFEDV